MWRKIVENFSGLQVANAVEHLAMHENGGAFPEVKGVVQMAGTSAHDYFALDVKATALGQTQPAKAKIIEVVENAEDKQELFIAIIKNIQAPLDLAILGVPLSEELKTLFPYKSEIEKDAYLSRIAQ